MAYDASTELNSRSPNAATGDPQTPSEEPVENASGAAGESFFIPKDMLEGKSYKAGDKITLEVVGEDADGDLEVKMPGESPDMMSELRDKLQEAETPSTGEQDNG